MMAAAEEERALDAAAPLGGLIEQSMDEEDEGEGGAEGPPRSAGVSSASVASAARRLSWSSAALAARPPRQSRLASAAKAHGSSSSGGTTAFDVEAGGLSASLLCDDCDLGVRAVVGGLRADGTVGGGAGGAGEGARAPPRAPPRLGRPPAPAAAATARVELVQMYAIGGVPNDVAIIHERSIDLELASEGDGSPAVSPERREPRAPRAHARMRGARPPSHPARVRDVPAHARRC